MISEIRIAFTKAIGTALANLMIFIMGGLAATLLGYVAWESGMWNAATFRLAQEVLSHAKVSDGEIKKASHPIPSHGVRARCKEKNELVIGGACITQGTGGVSGSYVDISTGEFVCTTWHHQPDIKLEVRPYCLVVSEMPRSDSIFKTILNPFKIIKDQ